VCKLTDVVGQRAFAADALAAFVTALHLAGPALLQPTGLWHSAGRAEDGRPRLPDG